MYNLEVNRDGVKKELDQLKKNLSDEELLEENYEKELMDINIKKIPELKD